MNPQSVWTPVVFLSRAIGPAGLPPELVGCPGESALDLTFNELQINGVEAARIVFFKEDITEELRPKRMRARLRDSQIYWAALHFKVDIEIAETLEDWLHINADTAQNWEIVRPEDSALSPENWTG